MRSGIPSVSVYGAGTSDIIQHQVTGFGVNYGARDEFARWTKFILERPSDAAQMAKQGRDHVTQNFSTDAMFAKFEELYVGQTATV